MGSACGFHKLRWACILATLVRMDIFLALCEAAANYTTCRISPIYPEQLINIGTSNGSRVHICLQKWNCRPATVLEHASRAELRCRGFAAFNGLCKTIRQSMEHWQLMLWITAKPKQALKKQRLAIAVFPVAAATGKRHGGTTHMLCSK